MDLFQTVRDAVVQIEGGDVSPFFVGETLDRMGRIKEMVRDLQQTLEIAAIKFIQRNGDITIGETRWYCGSETITKCRDARATLDKVLEASGGDMDGVAAMLSSNAFKHGACKGLLDPEAYDACFEKIVLADIKTGKPKRSLQKVNTKFVKPLR